MPNGKVLINVENLKISIRTVGKMRNWLKRKENYCESRVPQGLILSLILLNVFSNDFATKSRSVLLLFLNGTKLSSLVRTEEVGTSASNCNGPSD